MVSTERFLLDEPNARLHILSEKGGIQARSKSAEFGLGQDQEIVHLI